ncbi:MAG: tRNA 2-thiouridine(34) synthase MnmA [Clostridia bacterium]|nr:tRNA 2-thiouridine(34) synthase MnmA [Clostridia bacterium]
MIKVALGLSGGVDSAVAAALLREEGYAPIGVFLRMHRVGNEEAAARKAAEELGIPFYLKDMTALFEEQVMRPVAMLYQRGETPNPCILCNPAVKFRGLLEAADALGCAKIATGHYAAVEKWGDLHLIKRIPGQLKDQSYMLYGLPEECRSRLLLPLGVEKGKEAIRAMAAEKGLSAANKKDSLDICFLEEGSSHGAFIEKYTGSPPAPGKILSADGALLGTHEGICHYTVGQRRGLGVSADQRLYVTALDPVQNVVTLGPKEQAEHTCVYLRNVVLHCPLPEEGLTVKVRSRDRDTSACLELLEDHRGILHFDQPKMAPAPGQSAVFYCRNFVIGGGIIDIFHKKV